MSMPLTMRSCLPNTIIQSWRTSLSQQRTSKPIQPSLRTFFSSNGCLRSHKPSHPTSRLFSSLKSSSSSSSSSRSTTQTPQHSSSIPSAIPSIRTLLTEGRVHQAQNTWSPILHARGFSLSALVKAARPNWYAGRQVETVRAGPIKKAQWWMDRKIPKSWLFYGIIVTNIVVFLGWQYAINSATRFRDFGPYVFMMQNFAASWANLVRPWTILTSCFSHMDTGHIFVNLFSFYFMGQAAMSILSTSQFASLYLLAGLAGNAVQMLWHPFQGSGNSRQPAFALGASGAISGVLSFYAMAFPHHKLILFFVIPAPAWLAVSGIIAYDMYTAIARPNGGIAAAAHLGGAGAGILYFLKLVGRRPF